MFRSRLVLLLVFTSSLYAQQAKIQQSPRQALIEMFFSGGQAAFETHLPDATKLALVKAGAMRFGVPMLGSLGFHGNGQVGGLQIVEAGPILAWSRDPRTGEKFQVNIDTDDLMGDQAELALSFHTFKGEVEDAMTTFYPKVNLKMALQGGVWKLKEIGLGLRLPLDDPEFLKALTQTFQKQESATSGMLVANDLGILQNAEVKYRALHPEHGFTCSLQDLAIVRFGHGNSSALVLDRALASGTKDGYKFAIGGCGSPPVTSFEITAVPLQAGKPALCADQSGSVKYSADGQAENCVANGQPWEGQRATGFGAVAHFAPTTAGHGSGSAERTRGRATVVVRMGENEFTPARLTIAAGQTVLWKNTTGGTHTVTLLPERAVNPGDAQLPKDAKPFDSGIIPSGGTFRQSFTAPGTYKYFCSQHEDNGMVGEIVVRR